MKEFWWTRNYVLSICLTILLSIGYVQFAYNLVRTDYMKLTLVYALLFMFSYFLYKNRPKDIKWLVVASFVFRALFIMAIPNLSQDFYRFIWDGRMILEGFSPYLYTPQSFIEMGQLPVNQAKELYAGMGFLNGSHYTNYPPINQLFFVLAAFFSKSNILGAAITMRIFIILADLGILYYGKKLLQKLQLPSENIFFYILNPFIIIELTGNLHFEGIMLFFLIWSLYLLHNNQFKWAAVIFGLSVSVKLIPLLFLPLFYQKLGFKKSSLFYVIVGVVNILLFLPFVTVEFINNYLVTVGLWFQNFEFNASIYYLVREIGYKFRGYNEIAIIGKILPLIVFVGILLMAFFKKAKTTEQLITVMLLALSFYYFMATTVHPWYIASLVLLTLFTNYKYPIVWSFVIILSYLAYANIKNEENLWLVTIQYLIVYGLFCYEVFLKKNEQKLAV